MKVADVLRLLEPLDPQWPVRAFAVGFFARTTGRPERPVQTDVVLFLPSTSSRAGEPEGAAENGPRVAGPDEPAPPPCAPPQGSPTDPGDCASNFACEVCGIDPVPAFSLEHSNEFAEYLGVILCEQCARRLERIARLEPLAEPSRLLELARAVTDKRAR